MTTDKKQVDTAPSKVPIAVNVQRGGVDFARHDILQVALATGPSIDKINTASYCFNHDGALRFDKTCKDLWTGQLHLLERIQSECKNGESVAETWQTVRIAWDAISKDDRVVFVTTNDYVDMSAIHHGFESHCPRISTQDNESHMPPPCSLAGAVRNMINPYHVIKGFGTKRETELLKQLDTLQKQTHWAADEARRSLVLYFLAMSEIDAINARDAATPLATPAKKASAKTAPLEFELMISGFESEPLG
jgi:hypothetical protein